MKLLDVQKELSAMQESGQLPDEIDLTKVDSVFGAMSLPDDVATIQKMNGAQERIDLPFDIFIMIKFADKQTTDASLLLPTLDVG